MSQPASLRDERIDVLGIGVSCIHQAMTNSLHMSQQRGFWNDWNAQHREAGVDPVMGRQAQLIEKWLKSLEQRDLELLEVGCGTGWLVPKLLSFGKVTATDLSDEVLARAQERLPEAKFFAGDFMALDFGKDAFDVAISLEVLSHVRDQPAFIAKIAGHLKPGGHLMLATQNRFVLQYLNRIPPPGPGQLRRWVDRHELRALLQPEFDVLQLFTVTPRLGRGLKGAIWPAGRKRSAQHDRPEAPGTPHRPRTAITRRTPQWLLRPLERLGLGWTLMALARKRA